MDMFDDYGGLYPMGMDPELESALQKCETEEQRQKLMEDYALAQVKAFAIILGILFLVLIIAGIISICKGGSLGVARFLDTLYLKIL